MIGLYKLLRKAGVKKCFSSTFSKLSTFNDDFDHFFADKMFEIATEKFMEPTLQAAVCVLELSMKNYNTKVELKVFLFKVQRT